MEDKKYSKLKSVFEATQSQVPDDFTKRVMKRIEEQTSVPHPKRHRMWFYPTIAAAASVLLLLTLHYSEGPTSLEAVADLRQGVPTPGKAPADSREGIPTPGKAPADLRERVPAPRKAPADSREGVPAPGKALADSREGVPAPGKALADRKGSRRLAGRSSDLGRGCTNRARSADKSGAAGRASHRSADRARHPHYPTGELQTYARGDCPTEAAGR